MIITSKVKNYTVEFIDKVLEKKDLLKTDQKYLYLIDDNVYKIYREQLEPFIAESKFILIPANEDSKSFHSLAKVYRALINNEFRKNDVLVTFGGGAVQDISGFVASTIYRGVKWIFFPTTLLAQADSCIGSKTSINFDESKNLIGTFYPPNNIYIDVNFLNTLRDDYFYSGVGEIIKFHLMADNERYQLLKKFLNTSNLKKSDILKKIIKSTLVIKKSYFEEDELDLGRRNLLNYGHCFGHALESASNFEVSHGQAVIVGMGFANLLSLRRGIMKKEKYDEFEGIFKKYYPRFDMSKVDVKDIIYYLKRDKKRVGKDLTMILSEDVGKQSKLDDIKEEEIIEIFNDFIRTCLW